MGSDRSETARSGHWKAKKSSNQSPRRLRIGWLAPSSWQVQVRWPVIRDARPRELSLDLKHDLVAYDSHLQIDMSGYAPDESTGDCLCGQSHLHRDKMPRHKSEPMRTKEALMSKRYTIFFPSLKILGGNRVLFAFARDLIERGVPCSLVVASRIGSATFGISPDKIKFLSGGGSAIALRIFAFLKCALAFRRLPSDEVVVISDPLMAILFSMAGGREYIRYHQADDYILFDHNPRVKARALLRVYKALTRRSYRDARAKNYFVSKYVEGEFLRHGGVGALGVVNPGVSSSFFCSERRNPKVVGLIARDLPWKGYRDFESAINKVPRSCIDQIILISQDKIKANLIHPYTVLSPKDDRQLALILRQIGIFVHPSWTEGYGLPPLEAMAAGCAVIVSETGGVREYARAQINCLFFPPGDVNHLAMLLQQLLSDANLRNRLISAAELTAKEFSESAFAESFRRAIEF